MKEERMDPTRAALADPSEDFEADFRAMAEEYLRAGEAHNYRKHASMGFSAYVRRLRQMAQGEGLPPGHVPMTTYWLVEGGATVVGESHLRHRLTPELEIEGGHIGYLIRPSRRRQGYGTLLLALTLAKARERGLRRVLVTCDTDNIASARVIEKNGGVPSGTGVSPRSGKVVNRYWLDLCTTCR